METLVALTVLVLMYTGYRFMPEKVYEHMPENWRRVFHIVMHCWFLFAVGVLIADTIQ